MFSELFQDLRILKKSGLLTLLKYLLLLPAEGKYFLLDNILNTSKKSVTQNLDY